MKNSNQLEMPASIVVRGVNWVGDTIMTLPAWRDLRRIFPSSTITAWVPGNLAALLTVAGVADKVMVFDPSDGGPGTRVFKMASMLRGENFDIAIFFQNAFEAALTAFMAKIPLRVGFPTDLRGPLLSHKIHMPRDIRSRHQVYYYLEITRQLAMAFNSGADQPPQTPDCAIQLGAPSLKAAQDILTSESLDPRAPLFCLCPGSVNSEAKRWPVDLWAELADHIHRELRGGIVFMGASSEIGLIDEICQRSSAKCVNLAGKTDMIKSMGVMSLCQIVISNDTGSAHMAVASGSKVLTIFGPTIPGATRPFGQSAHIIQGDADCSPCRNFTCPYPDHPCMRSVTPGNVLSKALLILGLDEPENNDQNAISTPPLRQ